MRVLLIVLTLSGCALAIGDSSKADVNINNYPSIDVDDDTPTKRKEN